MQRGGNSDVKQMNTNNNKLMRNINNTIMENKNFLDLNGNAFARLRPKNREELLGLDLAGALNDYKNLPLYLSYARKYPEFLLRKVLGEVKEIPSEKVKKGRGALFTHLIKRYAQKTSNNLRD